jgi:hypothetical protein
MRANERITIYTDVTGVIAAATRSTPLGLISTAASVANNHSTQNKVIAGIGLIPGFDVGMGITGALTDYMDYGINNSTPGPQKAYNNHQLEYTIPTQDDVAEAALDQGP